MSGEITVGLLVCEERSPYATWEVAAVTALEVTLHYHKGLRDPADVPPLTLPLADFRTRFREATALC
jgi:hypothetical protein